MAQSGNTGNLSIAFVPSNTVVPRVTRKLISWNPHFSSHFVVTSSDLRLYELKIKKGGKATSSNSSSFLRFSLEDPTQNDFPKGETKSVSLVGVNYEIQAGAKCLSWCPIGGQSNATNVPIAVGLPSGKTLLTSFATDSNKIAREFVPRHTRACNAVAWNPVQTNQLAAGLDKVRGDFSTLVWDINQSGKAFSSTDVGVGGGLTSVDGPSEGIGKPLYELANSEATVALAWMPSSPSCLVSGTSVKWLRIYDLRGGLNTPQSVIAHSKAVHGVCFNPLQTERLATFSEDGLIKLWDIRNLGEPIFSFNSNSKGLLQIEWCPTRSGLLASISKEEKSIKFWDITDTITLAKRDNEASHKPSRVHETQEILSSFSWHPTNQYRILTVTNSGTVEMVSLQETIPLAWSPHGFITFGCGKSLITGFVTSAMEPETKTEIFDISLEMKIRAQDGYSMDIESNVKLISEKEVQVLWKWMHSFASSNFGKEQTLQVETFQGIQSILASSTAPSKKLERDKHLLFPIYTSPQRSLCMHICGWTLDKSDVFEQTLVKLEEDLQFERAAALAVFCLDLKRAITSLTRGSASSRDYNFQLVSMALAGCSEAVKSGSTVWKETCFDVSNLTQLNDPYLRACFLFLCADSGNFLPVIEDSQLLLSDRIAFACRFLDDAELNSFIEKIMKQHIKSGSLEGVILTGLGPGCVDLFEQYVNVTGDIQTPALALSFVVPKKFKHPKVERWVTAYCQLLDRWQLWHQRARFDIARRDVPRPQIYVRCHFCNQSLSMGMILPRRVGTGAPRSSTGAVQKQKISNCPSCGKTLPRCAVCLLSFNCNISNKAATSLGATSPFDDWFTWCQNCRHGGHASHIMAWFKDHKECPVSDCNCPCATL